MIKSLSGQAPGPGVLSNITSAVGEPRGPWSRAAAPSTSVLDCAGTHLGVRSCYHPPYVARQKLNRAGEHGAPSALTCFQIIPPRRSFRKFFIWKYLRCTKRSANPHVPSLQLKKEKVANSTKGPYPPLPGCVPHLLPGNYGHAHFGVY